MRIHKENYYNLIQTHWESRSAEYTDDVKRPLHEWNTKLSTKIGFISATINNRQKDSILLTDIMVVAELLRAWFWTLSEPDQNFNCQVEKERVFQIEMWGMQDHSRHRWLAIAVEEAGEIADAIERDLPKIELIHEIIQLSAVLFTWVTNKNWFDQPNAPIETKCRKCGESFETGINELIKCPKCQTQHDIFGNQHIPGEAK